MHALKMTSVQFRFGLQNREDITSHHMTLMCFTFPEFTYEYIRHDLNTFHISLPSMQIIFQLFLQADIHYFFFLNSK